MTLEQKIKEIEGALEVLPHRNTGIPQKWHKKYISLALEVIRELQAENTALKARLQPTPEAPNGIKNIELQLQDNGKTLKVFLNLPEQNQQEVTND